MKFSAFISALVLAFALPAVGFTEDQVDPGKASDAVKTPNPAGVQSQFSGAITAVNRADKTITIDDTGKVSHRLHIGDTTKMKRGDRDATWDDLKVGAKVDGTCSGDADMAHAETLNING
jgi:hypothetical protein